MSTLLVLRNSLNGEQSVSNAALDEFVAQSLRRWPQTRVVYRDLVAQPVPALTAETVAAIRNGVKESPAQIEADRLANELIDEIKAADYLAIGLPRYNFNVPASFKTYIDYLARPRIAFRYGANGPEGLLRDIPVYAFVASGGVYSHAENDFYVAWLKHMLSFIGFKRVHFIHTEGVAGGVEAPLAQTRARIEELLGK